MISNLCLTTNGFHILETGSAVLPYWDSDLKMSVEFESGFSFEVVFNFISVDGEESNIHKTVEDKTIIFVCKNCNNQLGNGSREPISIATVEGKKIYLHFTVYMRGNKQGRKIEYTFLEKE